MAAAFLCLSLTTLAQAAPGKLPSAAPSDSEPAASGLANPEPEARVDINRASIDELMKVPGMTRSWAGRIVRFRPYRTKQDLLDRGVVTSTVYDRIKDAVVARRDKQ
jgi:DNA uptake protein ComE-like DNA-binding protein